MSSSRCSSANLDSHQSVTSKTISISLKLLLSGSLSILSLFGQGFISKASAAEPIYFYVSPGGSDSNVGSNIRPFKTIQKARDVVSTANKNMAGDIVVILKNGTYTLSKPLTFGPEDSGTNGYNIIYKADTGAKVTISGGKKTGRWILTDSSKNIYRAWIGNSYYPREFYVGDARATRARSLDDPTGFTRTETGYTTTDLSLQSWKNISDLEIVSTNDWKSFRCGVSGIVGGNITMDQPCFKNSLYGQTPFPDGSLAWPILNPSWIENAYELLDKPGEWYYKKQEGTIYYKPHPNEDLSKIETVVPILDKLIVGTGTLDKPVHNIIFQDLNLKYGTWYDPNSADGYSSLQAGYHWVGDQTAPSGRRKSTKSPGNIAFSFAQNIVFKHNVFSHLSSAALDFETGSQNNTVENNHFEDISGSAIQLGNHNWGFDNYPDYEALYGAGDSYDKRNLISNNLIVDNYITKTGQEYHDTPGIYVGYTDHTRIVHNELTDMPYTGISMGWGWDGYTSTPARDNSIRNNIIHNFMNVLKDGGGIYTLSLQPNSVIDANYIYDQYNEPSYGGNIYPDQGSNGFTISNNVVINYAHRWVYVWNNDIFGNTVQNNFANSNAFVNNSFETGADGKSIAKNTFQNNTVVAAESFPTQAQDIINTAGIRSTAQQDVKNSLLPSLPNLALKQPATASSFYDPGSKPEMANDGVINNSWYAGWSAGGDDSSPWWQVDLGEAKQLHAIELTPRHVFNQPGTRTNFEIRISNDPTFATYTVVHTQGSTPLRFDSTLKADVFDSNSYRYVRIAKTQPEYFCIGEVKVF
jgi:F5/8 type C domain/Right handed beta helix region